MKLLPLNMGRVRESLDARNRIQSKFGSGTMLVEETIPVLLIMRDTFAKSNYRKDRRDRIAKRINAVLSLAMEIAGPHAPTATDYPSCEDHLHWLQVKCYFMAGGGLIGNSAATRPGDFYIDDRANDGHPFVDTEVYAEVAKLAEWAKEKGSDPCNLPFTVDIHHAGLESE